MKKIHFCLTLLFLALSIYFFRESRDLNLSDYEPRSTLKLEEHKILKAKYPVIDIHKHLDLDRRTEGGITEWVEKVVSIMDSCNVNTMVDMDAAYKKELMRNIENYQEKYPGRFIHFVHFNSLVLNVLEDPDFDRIATDRLEESYLLGARGVKIWKDLGTKIKDERDRVVPGKGPYLDRMNNLIDRWFPSIGRKTIPIDDPRFDPIWEKAGELNMPIQIHVGDPVAFFLPMDRFNERLEQLKIKPDWSFYGSDYPSYEELIDQRSNVMGKHPGTIFIGAHFGMIAEDLDYLGELLDTYDNFFVELSAALPILGRQPYRTRKFFIEYQDRILFGTDGIPRSTKSYSTYFRFLETFDEYFDYPERDLVNQGRWKIYGIGLPDDVLEKIYYKNAERILQLHTQ